MLNYTFRVNQTFKVMKRIAWFFLILLMSCSNELRVYSDWDRDYDINKFKTYAWASKTDMESKNNPLYYNELTDKRIKNIINTQLPPKGLALASENADIIVHYHIVVDDKTAFTTDPYGLYGPYWTRTGYYQYKEGTLIIDFMDSKTNNLVWRGWAVSIIDDNSEEIREETLMIAITKILEHFKNPMK